MQPAQLGICLLDVLEAPDAVPDYAYLAIPQHLGNALAILQRRLHHRDAPPETADAAEPAADGPPLVELHLPHGAEEGGDGEVGGLDADGGVGA